ncbi:hypothetical protein I204_04875 [Kwoniella mangroviensis CBS 8886]|uniref:uncharacterized protein n=1 Tax=Kwoniella mangroviensis CBS 8507 TaxID=1296122 RepID=UPI00080CE81F|nr:uncharacterized protein I203_06288 [Kwoniella mangroviensis CBS 8507]OCF64557.1 hypothetical protein I203_06288 [Kwoniella mangroviensis CBS 8507]OCF74500.1 hypothetical protein I204_04875 [Kwoniella mangroviensis CBS 8886]
MNQLTSEQAQALWSAGGFLVFDGLSEGSEFGIDGSINIIRKFSGIKFLPPGMHLITWSPTSSASSSTTGPASPAGPAGPAGIPIRSGIIRYTKPKERFVIRYDSQSEHTEVQLDVVISDDRLKSLDGEMAPYPFDHLERWKSLTSHITEETIIQVIGGNNRVINGLIEVEGEEEDSVDRRKGNTNQGDENSTGGNGDKLNFVRFNLKKSWRDGAIGEEVTRYSKDKSWLLGDVVERQLGGDPIKLISQLQLSFILLLHLSSYSALLVYKRILTLLCQSTAILYTPSEYSSSSTSQKEVQETFVSLVDTLASQIQAIPDGTFDTELPELDVFYLDQIDSMRKNLSGGISISKDSDKWDENAREKLGSSWTKLKEAGKPWGWEIGDLSIDQVGQNSDDDEESEEEGEYAPVIVEM